MTQNKGKGHLPHASQPGLRIHIDIFGSGKTLGRQSDDEAPPVNGKIKYTMLITDDATRFQWIFPLTS